MKSMSKEQDKHHVKEHLSVQAAQLLIFRSSF